MSGLIFFLILAVLFLAYANGANDNFKGVATLFGSGTASYRVALLWATLTTLAGSLLALLLAQGLVESFTGKGLVTEEAAAQPAFLLAVSIGAAVTVLLASWLGLPVSTTHALLGSLLGAGLLAGGQVSLHTLGKSFVLPLLFSPLAALFLTAALYPLLHRCRRAWGISQRTCICLGGREEEVQVMPGGRLALVRTQALVTVAEARQCRQRYQGRFLGLEAGWLLEQLHFVSAGAVSFARGLNDTPKIVALLLASSTVLPASASLVLVAGSMAVGGWLSARRVAETLSRKITSLNPGQGLTANLTTAFLVTCASRWGLPVSTTHVAVGALCGIGWRTGSGHLRTILTILTAWVTTLPLGMGLGAAVFFLLNNLYG